MLGAEADAKVWHSSAFVVQFRVDFVLRLAATRGYVQLVPATT
jgi:hypothetical protein